ncbi:MAG: STAS domain-containing protein [Kordiimonadaceae bacterium]|nr:STAS domain-containing protein [Kordiimonadaceae bacterium]
MDYKIDSTSKGLKIEIDGMLTFDCHKDFKNILTAIKEAHKDVEISLKGLSNMDSAGAGMLKLAQHNTQNNDKDFELTDVPKELKVIVDLLR